jgi:hypothetical protein
MTQPTRWLDDHNTSAEIRELLHAGSRPPRFPRVALAATIIPLVQKAALAKTAVLSSAAAVALKATTVGLAIGLGSIAAVKTLSGPEPATTQTVQQFERPTLGTSKAPRSVAAATETEQSASPVAVADDSPAITLPSPAAVASAATGIAAEAQLLERARSLLDESPARALMLAGEHRERFAKGQMTAERELIAIDALLRLGRHQEAKQRAQPFLADGASQVFAQRLRNLLDRHTQ